MKLVLEQQLMSDEITMRSPVAVNYMKFPVDKLGVLQPAKDDKLNTVAAFKLVKEEDNKHYIVSKLFCFKNRIGINS